MMAPPARGDASGLKDGITLPPTRNDPWSGARAPARIFMRVDFPAPFSPTTACTSPLPTAKLTPRRACTPGKAFAMPRISRAGAVGSTAIPILSRELRGPSRGPRRIRLFLRVVLLDPGFGKLADREVLVIQVRVIVLVQLVLLEGDHGVLHYLGHRLPVEDLHGQVHAGQGQGRPPGGRQELDLVLFGQPQPAVPVIRGDRRGAFARVQQSLPGAPGHLAPGGPE